MGNISIYKLMIPGKGVNKKMPIRYKIDVLAALKEKGYTTTRIRKEKLIGEATIQRLRHKQSVSFDVLSKLCALLECDIGDILTNEEEQE